MKRIRSTLMCIIIVSGRRTQCLLSVMHDIIQENALAFILKRKYILANYLWCIKCVKYLLLFGVVHLCVFSLVSSGTDFRFLSQFLYLFFFVFSISVPHIFFCSVCWRELFFSSRHSMRIAVCALILCSDFLLSVASILVLLCVNLRIMPLCLRERVFFFLLLA